MIHLIAQTVAGRMRLEESDRDDAVSEAVITCLRKVHKISEPATAGGYLGTICFNAIRKFRSRVAARRCLEPRLSDCEKLLSRPR